MRNIIVLLLAAFVALGAHAVKYTCDYMGKPVSEALVGLSKRYPDLNISFIYDDLENYKVKGKVFADSPLQAVKQLVAFNPISVIGCDGDIYVEALQKGKYKYTGRAVSPSREPVAFATVILLNPKDSTAITYGITDERGRFSIPCDRRKVLAKFSSIGYKKKYVAPASFNLGDVVLDILAINLNALTATADSRYALSDRTVYVPTTREKNAAQGGADLLRFMAIPSLSISPADNSVSTLSGQGVAAFIDYLPATSQDLKNLRPEDVKKVEVFDYPSDPRFQGALHVVNFIMEKYVYGGYTKVNDQQRLDFRYGYYSLSSKFSYGKMTYDVYTGYDHFKSNRESSASVTEYDFDDGTVIRSRSTPESHWENNEAYLSARAKYATEKTVISNQLSIRHSDTPENLVVRQNEYTPAIFPSGESFVTSTYRSLTPSWNGSYHFTLPRSLRLVVSPSATYARNNSFSDFTEDGTGILNRVKEDAWNANISLALSKNWGRQSMSVSLNGELGDNRLHYTGNNPADIHYASQGIGAFLRGNFVFGKFWIQPSVKCFITHTSFGNENYTECLPGYYVAGGVNFSRKHQLSVSSEMSNWSIGISNRSPNIVVNNLLDAVKGNPDLKAWRYNSFNIDYTWIPLQWLNMSVYGQYFRHTKPMDYVFTPTEIDGRGMMLRSYVKEGYFQNISGGISVSARLFNNSLSLQGYVSLTGARRGGTRKYSRTYLNSQLSTVYYLGDFYFVGQYEFRSKSSDSYWNRMDQPSYYVFRAGWSRKGWNICADIRNPFRSSWQKGSGSQVYENYSNSVINYGAAYRRQFWITATYTVSYGKKLKVEGIGRGNTISSGIVN